MDLKLIHVFLTVHKYQSFTGAAEALGVSQSAVSQAIKRLEVSLQKKLFIKSGRTMICTRTADQLAIECGRGMDIIQNAISTTHHFIVYCPEDLIQITREMPHTTFKLPPTLQETLLSDLRLQKVDLAIDFISDCDNSFISERVCTEQFKVICRHDHPRLSGNTITKEEFSSESHIGYKRKFKGMSIFQSQIDRNEMTDLERNVVMEVSSSHSICMIAAQTDYVGVVRESVTKRWADKLGLSVMDFPKGSEVEFPLNLIYHNRFKNHSDHAEMREAVKAQLIEICS
ncbi:LysR family transcriptional regulator [Vibrio inusitatus NBRC 102082]|uniref:LysR family transcriptional regulator n=1 Tax=Vibrio inusitatus NBRC 102082 TaxID=1219070 RepID=A0A4Y3HXP1_9VIBR|nr:LysR family transcriptional regulator [Vibrio inusitatus]GEA51480.1 LysR family transcriptional regulator [Vibrio inusitatus NBRC 102082]